MCWQQRERAGSGSPCEGPWEPFSSGAPSPAYPWCRAHCPTSLLAPRDNVLDAMPHFNVPCHPPALCALSWGPGCQLAKGPGEGGCPLPLPHCPGTWGATRGSSLSCAGAMSRRFAHGGNLGVGSPTLPSFPSEVCCPQAGGEWRSPTGSCSAGSARGKHIRSRGSQPRQGPAGALRGGHGGAQPWPGLVCQL